MVVFLFKSPQKDSKRSLQMHHLAKFLTFSSSKGTLEKFLLTISQKTNVINANALLSVRYRYHALSLVSLVSLFESLGRAMQNDTWQDVWNNTGGEIRKYIVRLNFFQFYRYFQSEPQEMFITQWFNYYSLSQIVRLWLPVVNFRESASVWHTFLEKLLDNDLLLRRVPGEEPIYPWMFNNCLKASGRKLNVLCA